MAGSTIRIEGLDDLVAGLRKEGALAKARGDAATAKVAERVRTTGQELAPKGSRPHEGEDLAPSIRTDRRGSRFEVGPTARHGGFMEYGTYKDAPQPYMGPAVNKHEPELEQELSRLVGDL